MGFNMSDSEVGRGECLQPRGGGPARGMLPREIDILQYLACNILSGKSE